MNDERIDELIALSVLGELSDEQERELDAALSEDPSRVADLAADEATAAALQRVHAETPPPNLRSNVLTAIASTEQEPPTASSTSTSTVSTSTVSAAPPETGPVSLERARSRRLRWQPFAAAAAVALLFVGGVIASGIGRDDTTPIEAVIEAEDAQTRSFSGDLDGSLRAVWSPSTNALVIDGANLATLPSSEAYQLWFVDTSGTPLPGAVFRPDASGTVRERFDDVDPSAYTLAITVEPAAGSQTPTTPVIATA